MQKGMIILTHSGLSSDGDIKEIHYIPTGCGITAVHIITGGNPETGTTYYLAKDHLI